VASFLSRYAASSSPTQNHALHIHAAVAAAAAAAIAAAAAAAAIAAIAAAAAIAALAAAVEGAGAFPESPSSLRVPEGRRGHGVKRRCVPHPKRA
jgi:hypothetical protein